MYERVKYKEYSAMSSKMLLNVIDFSCCTKAICNLSTDLKFIEVQATDAFHFENKYQNELNQIEHPSEENIKELRNNLYTELTEKGYNIDNIVEPVIYNEE